MFEKIIMLNDHMKGHTGRNKDQQSGPVKRAPEA
jgi:hypothetical protein